eukprot:CAMPEP_0114037082 /NCGR_PEP_ID=MMETSP1339-20121228/1380_1 /TAXON_ID=94617 /ORGANISM="Fibrocapsa japonica" /LENGTH=37 /assembly_acc=CAM_ASM_000762
MVTATARRKDSFLPLRVLVSALGIALYPKENILTGYS